MSEYAYHDALDMLSRGLAVVCVNGKLDGEPIVYTRGFDVEQNHVERFLRNPDPSVRSAFIVPLVCGAREQARERGIVA